MNGWAIGGLVCAIYAISVGFAAYKKSPGLIKLVKMKLGKDIKDETIINICYTMAALVGVAGIVFFVLAAR